jgi:pyruvate/2-oxoglutarate/acetoin dehydrogenase E1 component
MFIFAVTKTNNMQKINKVSAVELINKTKGKIFTAEFRKKDNTTRVMNCRLGVTKGVNGTGMSYNPSLKGLKPVYDMQAKEWRMINLDTITRLSIGGEIFIVN